MIWFKVNVILSYSEEPRGQFFGVGFCLFSERWKNRTEYPKKFLSLSLHLCHWRLRFLPNGNICSYQHMPRLPVCPRHLPAVNTINYRMLIGFCPCATSPDLNIFYSILANWGGGEMRRILSCKNQAVGLPKI